MGARPAVLTLPLAMAMFLVSSRLSERPHLWTYLLAATFLWILDRHRRRPGRVAWLLLPLQAAWANLHGGFPLGWLLVGCFLLAELSGAAWARAAPGRKARRLALIALGLPLVCLINPVGYHLLLFPFRLTGSEAFMSRVYEWLPTFSPAYRGTFMFLEYLALTGLAALAFLPRLRGAARLVLGTGGLLAALGIYLGSDPVLALGLSVGAVGFLLGRGAVPLAHGLLFLALFFLSTRMNRTVTDYALLIAAPVAASLDRTLRRSSLPLDALLRRRPGTTAMIGGVVFSLLALWITEAGYRTRPTYRREMGLGVSSMPIRAVNFSTLVPS